MSNLLQRSSAADSIKTVEYSLRCFSLSVLGLIPLIGLPFVMMAFLNYHRARAICKGKWNPAQSYLAWGNVFSSLGVLISLLIILFLIFEWMKILPGQN
jgi:hypothetical protein